jgi:predicted CXXCH cytochrome family protein
VVLLVALVFGLLSLVPRIGALRLPGNQRGYEPTQPIAFSHRLHAGEMQISCLYCHSGAESSRAAGVPAASTCMNCHKYVTASLGAIREEDDLAQKEKRAPQRIVSPELQKLYDTLALDEKMRPDPNKQATPVGWVKVHNVPDYVYFDHRAHVNAGVTCQKCHGPAESMEQMRQVEDLSMGWCVNCHRDVNAAGVRGKPVHASIDCATCHY